MKQDVKKFFEPPTKAQLLFIEDICETLGEETPNCFTKRDASIWIAAHIKDYNECISDAYAALTDSDYF